MLSVAAQRAVADSLLERRSCRAYDGSTPSVHHVLSDDRYRPFGAGVDTNSVQVRGASVGPLDRALSLPRGLVVGEEP